MIGEKQTEQCIKYIFNFYDKIDVMLEEAWNKFISIYI